MDVVLAVVVLMMQPLALGALIAPPIVIAVRRRRVLLASLLQLGAVGSLFAWLVAWNADFDRADATGGAGNAFSGIGWLVVGLLLAAAALTVTRAPARAGYI
jgi:hypothetical protein